jgi:hypothetical protein
MEGLGATCNVKAPVRYYTADRTWLEDNAAHLRGRADPEMSPLLQDPVVATIAAPFVVAFVLTVVIRIGGGGTAGPRFAALAPCVAILVAYWLLEGPPQFPPTDSVQRLGYLAALAIALGIVLEATAAGRTVIKSAAALYPLAALLWLAEPELMASLSVDLLLKLLLLWLEAVFGLWILEYATQTAHLRVNDPEAKGGLDAPTLLMVAALGAAAVAFVGALMGMARFSFGIAAALAGYMLFNYLHYVAGGRSLAFGAMGSIGIGGSFFAGVYVMALSDGEVSLAALGVLFLVFVGDMFGRRVRFGSGRGARLVEPFLYAAVVLVPAFVAAAVAYVGSVILTGQSSP